MDRAVAPTYDFDMKSGPMLVVASVILGLVVVARFVHLVHEAEDAAPGREVSSQGAPSRTEQDRPARPALPQAQPAEPAPARPRSVGVGAAEANRKLTQIKVQKYVHEAYPAWLRAHPGEECPHQLIELNEYMEDKDANDAWGRPLKMLCRAALSGGAKRLKVISLGRDAERGTEDDITAGE